MLPDSTTPAPTKTDTEGAGAEVPTTATPPSRVARFTKTLGELPWTIWVSIAWVAVVSLSALLTRWLPLQDPNTPDYRYIASGPSAAHWLGTDQLGRDVLSRLVYGAQASLQVGLMAVLLGMTFGVALGLLAGYFGGWIDTAISALSDLVLAFPTLIFIMVLVAVRGASAPVLIFGIGAVMIPTFTRLTRANTLVWKRRDFVTAAQVLGAKRMRILVREVLPNVLPSVLAYAFIVVSVVMVAEGALSFLGFGLQPPTPSWGSMIAGGRNNLASSPHIVAFPALALLLTISAFNLLGDHFRGRAHGASEVTL